MQSALIISDLIFPIYMMTFLVARNFNYNESASL